VEFDELVPKLSFTKGQKFWTIALRRAMFEILKDDYGIIKKLLK
jgi:hypothetical protein